MMNRDFIIERLERKLAEKEKTIEELRKMLEGGGTGKIFEIESTVAELKKAVESIMSELNYIKAEIRELRSIVEGKEVAERNFELELGKEETEIVEEERCEESGEDDLIVCD